MTYKAERCKCTEPKPILYMPLGGTRCSCGNAVDDVMASHEESIANRLLDMVSRGRFTVRNEIYRDLLHHPSINFNTAFTMIYCRLYDKRRSEIIKGYEDAWFGHIPWAVAEAMESAIKAEVKAQAKLVYEDYCRDVQQCPIH